MDNDKFSNQIDKILDKHFDSLKIPVKELKNEVSSLKDETAKLKKLHKFATSTIIICTVLNLIRFFLLCSELYS